MAHRTETGVTPPSHPSDYPLTAETRASMAVTAYQWRVYDACREIPRGSTMTYGELARRIGGSAQAVGQALKRNPFSHECVPCHRVVAARGRIGGYFGHSDPKSDTLKRKWKLLKDEGVDLQRLQ